MSTINAAGIKDQYRHFINDLVPLWCDLIVENIFDDKGCKNILSRADEFKADIARDIISFTRNLSAVHHPLDNEKVKPLFDHYYSQYEVKPIAQQINRLRELLPGLGSADEKLADKPLPQGAEGYFAIPRWEAVASSYEAALDKVFTLIHDNLKWDVWDKTREGRLFNFRTGKAGQQYLRENEKAAVQWKSLCEAQKGYDILVVPAQFGLKYAGCSLQYAKSHMDAGEFGLNAFSVGVMLLTHRRRVLEYDDLWMFCPGDEYSLNGDGRFEAAPLYFFGNGMMEFDVINHQYNRCGSVSGFVPV
jgi:hypothetical protein